jgi:GNAT superfamily N-acetyltransferase
VAVQIRKATAGDLPGIASLAGELVRQHHGFDALRFMKIDEPEAGYEWWFGKEMRNKKALILCAKLDGEIVGYSYARVEPRDWNALLDACGALHDTFVSRTARRKGVGKRLLERTLKELRAMGAPRVVLHTAFKNRSAHKFFAAMGFRRTMLEMTCEL